MQPSGPVPTPSSTASGSGPNDPAPAGSASTSTSVESSADGGLAAWNRVLGELETRRRFSLLGPYQHARVLRWTDDEIDLGFPVELHSMGEMAADSTVVDEMRALMRELLGKPSLKLKIKLLDATESTTGPARSVLETTREKTHAERGKREAEAREHPITKHVLQTFGAQIKEIKTDV
jgi:hypothetical protein